MKLEEFCNRFGNFLKQEPKTPQLFTEGGDLLKEFISDPVWFGEFLGRLTYDSEFLKIQEPSAYPNEISLYRSPDRSFSVLGYLWEPGTSSSIHDHGSWGIVGTLINQVQEKKYRRVDDGQKDGYAELKEISTRRIDGGGTTSVLPLDEGIHLMEPVGDRWAVTISVYGKPVRRGYIQFFDSHANKVSRVYHPRVFKQVLAIRALKSMPGLRVKEMPLSSLFQKLPDYLAKEL